MIDRKECILADGKKWAAAASSSTQKRVMQATLKDLEAIFEKLEAPPAPAGAALGADGKVAAAQKSGGSNGTSDVSPEMVAKQKEMKDAAAKGDYITAGRIQAELEVSAKVTDMIVAKRKEMDAAAEKKDYVTAGKMQTVVQSLERNMRRLQDLERRMFESAAKQDFVKAGRFQEQYRILLESSNVKGGANSAAAAGALGASSKPSYGAALSDQLMHTMYGSAPLPHITGGTYDNPITIDDPYGYPGGDDYYGDY